jgi:hypothetical protein
MRFWNNEVLSGTVGVFHPIMIADGNPFPARGEPFFSETTDQ